MKEKKIKVGGVALFNGILFNSKYRQAIVQRKENNDISCRTYEYSKDKNILNKIPILRGILGLSSQINNATPEFLNSANEKKSFKLSTAFLYLILIVVCVSIPIIISIFLPKEYRSIGEFVIFIIEFLAYLLMLKSTDELDELFSYHGAEHKLVNAYENLNVCDITLENVKKQSRFHKRCGGNFIVYFIILASLSFFINIDNLLIKDIVLIAVTILNVGIAYEIVTILSLLPKPLDILNAPATLIQYITTKEPTDKQLEVALYGLLASVRKENGIAICEYVKKYVRENLKDKEYDVQDIYSILEYITHIDRNRLFLQKDSILLKISQEIQADKLLNKYYNDKYPLQYITHKQYFYNEEYYVDKNVLIPRQDSEVLVEKALEYINNEDIVNIIDLCTGSGALGISIAKNSEKDVNVKLLDISDSALMVANKNINKNGVSDKVSTLKSDLLEEIDESDKYDMIVSNPPYIKTDVIATLQEEVQKEPVLALDGGKDGLDYYIRIIKEAKTILKNNGIIIFEIGYDQLDDIKNIIKENNEFKLLESVKDYGGNDRVVICRFQEK